jgi:hypothetical protein
MDAQPQPQRSWTNYASLPTRQECPVLLRLIRKMPQSWPQDAFTISNFMNTRAEIWGLFRQA